MELDFKLDGVSALSKGIVLQKSIEFDEAVRNGTTAVIAGRDGEVHMTDGTFKSRKGNALCYCADLNSVSEKMADVMAFLFGDEYGAAKYRKLSTDDVYYWQAYVQSAGALSERMRRLNVFNISFICKPYRYLFSGDEEIIPENGGIITNPTGFSSAPEIYVTISGAGTVTVNGTTYGIAAYDTAIDAIIDCESLDLRGLDGTNLNGLFGRNFPRFGIGENTVSWADNVAVTAIIPHWRTL